MKRLYYFIKYGQIKHITLLTLILSLVFAIVIPPFGAEKSAEMMLAVLGILFGIVVGFFINDLWTRFEHIRENVSTEVSGLTTYFSFVKILASTSKKHMPFLKETKELISKYLIKFFHVEWHEYKKTDKEFDDIIDSLKDIPPLTTSKQSKTYNNMLPVLFKISTAREKLTMFGSDKLSKAEWGVVISLALTLLFALFSLKTKEITSIIFTWLLTFSIVMLLFVMRDLNNLKFGEDIISFEPYESIFDEMGEKRYYLKEDIESGRVKPPKGVKYKII